MLWEMEEILYLHIFGFNFKEERKICRKFGIISQKEEYSQKRRNFFEKENF